MEALAGGIVQDVAREVGSKAVLSILREGVSRLKERRGGIERIAVVSLVYSFTEPVLRNELLKFYLEKTAEIGVDEKGYIKNVARVSYDFLTLFDEMVDEMVKKEIELSEEEYLHLNNLVTKFIVWIDVLKWDKRSVKKVYSVLYSLLRALEDRYNGRYNILIYLRGRLKKKLKYMKVILADKEQTILALDPLDARQILEFLGLPGGRFGFL